MGPPARPSLPGMSQRRSTPPGIGGPRWSRELAALGADRAVVAEELAAAAETDPHTLYYVLAGTPVECAAAWVLFHQEHPSYGALMYLRHVWLDADRELRDWIVRQFAAMLLHGPRPVRESAGYGLWVDYFETPSDAPEVFRGLTEQLPRSRWEGLLSAAGPVPWPVKREAFLAAAEVPELHAALARGVAGSFYDVYGDVDAMEAARLVESITVTDGEVLAALTEATTRPLRLRTGSAILVTDPAWKHPGSFLLEAVVADGRWRWVPGSELVVDGTVHGRLRHWNFPFDGTPEHRLFPGHRRKGYEVHRVEAPPEHAEALANRELEAWPPGLREHVARPDPKPADDTT